MHDPPLPPLSEFVLVLNSYWIARGGWWFPGVWVCFGGWRVVVGFPWIVRVGGLAMVFGGVQLFSVSWVMVWTTVEESRPKIRAAMPRKP